MTLNISNPNHDGLREYQIEAKEKIYSAWNEGKRSVMLQMPTGTGKSHVMASIIRDFDNARQETPDELRERVLVVAHRNEIIDQIARIIERNGLAPSFIVSNGGRNREYNPSRRVQIASIQTLSDPDQNTWLRNRFPPRLILIDEAHHATAATYADLWNRFPEAHILGVTATPVRLFGAPLNEMFETLIASESIPFFMQNRFLSEASLWSKPIGVDMSSVPAVAGDYDVAVLDEKYGQNTRVLADLYESYQKHAKGKQGIVYAVNIAHGERIRSRYEEEGVRVRFIHGGTPQNERDGAIRAFRDKALDVLVNVNLFTEGFDAPDMDFVQLARPTMSLTMYLQMVGRALRPTNPRRKKLILDHAGLVEQHGDFRQDWDWPSLFTGEPIQVVRNGAEAIVERPYQKIVERTDELVELPGPELAVEFLDDYLRLELLDFVPRELANRFRTVRDEWSYTDELVDKAFLVLDGNTQIYMLGKRRYEEYYTLVESRQGLINAINNAQSEHSIQAIWTAVTPNDMLDLLSHSISDYVRSHRTWDPMVASFDVARARANTVHECVALMQHAYMTPMASILGPVFDEWDRLERGNAEPIGIDRTIEQIKAELRAIEEKIRSIYEEVIETRQKEDDSFDSKDDDNPNPAAVAPEAEAVVDELPEVGQDRIEAYMRKFLRVDRDQMMKHVTDNGQHRHSERLKNLLAQLDDLLDDKPPIGAYLTFYELIEFLRSVRYTTDSLSDTELTDLEQCRRFFRDRERLIRWVIALKGPIAQRDIEDLVRQYFPYSRLNTTMLVSWLRNQVVFNVDTNGTVSLPE